MRFLKTKSRDDHVSRTKIPSIISLRRYKGHLTFHSDGDSVRSEEFGESVLRSLLLCDGHPHSPGTLRRRVSQSFLVPKEVVPSRIMKIEVVVFNYLLVSLGFFPSW